MKSKVVISEKQKTAREEFEKIKKGLGLPYMNNEKKHPYIYIGNVTYTLKFRTCTSTQSHLNSGLFKVQPFFVYYGIIVFKNKFLLMSFINVAYSLNNFSK